jgi:putative ABC transport system permease protein
MKLLLLKTFRDMKSAWAQSLALIIIVALGIASLVAMAGAYRDLSTSYQRTYDELHFADVSFSVQAAPEAVVDDVAAVASVRAAAPRLVVDSGYELPNGDPIRTRLMGVPPGQQPQVNALYIREGRFLADDDLAGVLVESHFADYYKLKPGDSVTPIIQGQKKTLTVVGIVASPEYLVVSASKQNFLPSPRTFAVLWVSLPQLQAWTNNQGKINNINVLVQADADREQVIQRVEAVLEPYHLSETVTQEEVPSNAALKLDLGGFEKSAYIMAFLMLFVAAMAVYAMLSRLIWSQRPQIGLMKALGYSDGAVQAHYLALSLAIAVLGAIAGVALGIPLGRATTIGYAHELGIPLVQSNVYADLILIGVAMSLLFAILAGISPARSSARMPPAAAMRVDASQIKANGHRNWIERWVRLPLWLRLPLRDVFRNPRRTATTMLGIIFSFVLVLIGLGMADSMSFGLQRNFEQIETWDAMVTFNTPQTAASLDKVRAIAGVRAAEPVIQLPAMLKAHGHEQEAFLIAIQPEDSLHVLQLPAGQTPQRALKDGHLVLTGHLVDVLALAPDDEVTISSFLGEHTYRYSQTTDELGGTLAYISFDEAQRQIGAPLQVFNILYLRMDMARVKAIKQALYHLPGVANVEIKADVQKDWQSMMGLFYAFVGVILVFAMIMAFALLFNSMTINVLERQRELATMRAIGASGWRIARLVLVETGILWAITLIPGLLLGWWANRAFVASFSGDLFTMLAYISPASFVWTAAGVLLTMLISTLPAIRHITHLNLAEVTKMMTS